MRETKRVFRDFDYRQCSSFAWYLEEMSRKGWHFEKWSFGLIFRRGEPEEVVYSVEVFPDGRDGDLRPAQNTEEYAQYCEAAGWKFLDGKKKFCIFRREREDAVPIVEPEERMENVIRAQRKQQSQELIGNVALALFYWYNFWCDTFNMTFAVTPLLMVIAAMTITAVVNAICYIRLEIWVRRSRLEWKRQKKEPDYICRSRILKGWGYAFFVVALFSLAAYWADMIWIIPVLLTFIGVMFVLDVILECIRPGREMKIFIWMCAGAGMLTLFLVSFWWLEDVPRQPVVLDPPVAFEDLWPEQEAESADSGLAQSFLGSRLYYYCPENDEELEPGGNGLWYDQYDSRYGWVLERIWGAEKQRFSGGQLDPAEVPGAQQVLASRDRTKWLVRYPDRIVSLESAQMLEESEQQQMWEAFDSESEY